MRSHGRETQAAALGNDDRSAIRQVVGCRARRSGHDQSVSLVVNQKLSIHLRANRNHGRIVTLQYGNIVKGKRIACQDTSLCLYLNDDMFLYLALTGIQAVQGCLHLARQHISQETQSPHIDTDDGCSLGSHSAGSLEEGAVASHGDDIIHIEVVILEHSCRLHIDVLTAGEKLVIGILHIDFGAFLR